MSLSVETAKLPVTVVPPPRYTAFQALDRPSFVPPKLDGSLYFAEFIDWHLQWSESHNYAILVGTDGQPNIPITWGEFGRAIHRVAHRLLQSIPDGPADTNGKPRVIAMLTSVEPVTYFTIVLAIMRAGFQPFPLSNRNSVPALKHLLSTSGVKYLIASSGKPRTTSSALEETTRTVVLELEREGYPIKLIRPPHFWEAYPRLQDETCSSYDAKADAAATALLPPLRSLASYKNATGDQWPGMMLHSSGSTKFPKIICLDQRMLRHWGDWPWYGDRDIGGTVCVALGLAPFHAGGWTIELGLPISCGSTIVHFRPAEPATLWTSESAFYAIKKAAVDWIVSTPNFLDGWSFDPEVLKHLSSVNAIYSAGAPLSLESGDRLIQSGVNIMNLYGSTEVGILTKLSMERRKDWQYMEMSSFFKYRLVADDSAGLAYRLVIEACDIYAPSLTNMPGERDYDTSDLVVPHPDNSGTIRVLGRADDQIMHSIGEKTNPGPLENTMLGSPLVKSAVYFGRARPLAGILVEPTDPVQLSNEKEIAEFRNAIYPYVERANKLAPSHSRVFKEYILIADVINKPLARTAKGSIQRSVVLAHYEEEINRIYDAVDQYNGADWAKLPSRWDAQSIRDFIAQVVNGVVNVGLSDQIEENRDLFEQGCDSLQATVIRNSILNALRQRSQHMPVQMSADLVSTVPAALVYSYPTLHSLSSFVVDLVLGSTSNAANVKQDPAAEIRGMLNKYDRDYPDHQEYVVESKLHTKAKVAPFADTVPKPPTESVLCVLITGTTGTLGTYLLAALLRDPQVTLVFALNRPNMEKTLLDRQVEAFVDRGLDGNLVNSDKLRLIEAVISEADLGIDPMLYHEIRTTITTIIHNAWRLDFNLTLGSFESLIKGSRHLVDLALASPHAVAPQFLFASSIGVIRNWSEFGLVPEQAITDPNVALGMGYGESKWVVEEMLRAVSQQRGLNTTSIRLGQLSGSTINGAWNVTDWVPHLVKSGQVMGVLPSVRAEETISWIPVDIASNSIIDAMHNPQEGNRVLHIVHLCPIRWNLMMEKIAAGLETRGHAARLVPYTTWFAELEASGRQTNALERNPALKLLSFFRSGIRYDAEPKPYREAMGYPMLQTSSSLQICRSLRAAPMLGTDDVMKWMQYWDERKLLV